MKELIGDPSLIEELRNARRHRTPWLGKGAIRNVDSFFSVNDLEKLINQGGIWSPERLQVFLDNQPLPAQNIFQSKQTPAGPKPEISLRKLQEVLRRGCSVVLNDVCPVSPGVMKLREIFADWTRGKLECNVYFSQKDHQAFPIHYDVHDVFAIQVAGKKQWQIFSKATEYPINHPIFTNRKQMNAGDTAGPALLDFEFEPGDLVYIPSGFFHHAMCKEDRSLHLSFGLVEMIGMDVISLAFETAIREEFFRTPVNSMISEKDPVDFYLRKWAARIKDLSTDPEFKKLVAANLKSFRYRSEELSIKPLDSD